MDAQHAGTVQFAPNVEMFCVRTERTNQLWLDELSGHTTRAEQRQAHADLARHLYRVAVAYLNMHCENVSQLDALSQEEVAQLAQDFVQEELEALARNNFALLAQFNCQGRFLSWMTQLLVRTMASELRLWAEKEAMLEMYLDQLSPSQRTAFWERVVEQRPVDEVGALMGVSANQVHSLVECAKEQLRCRLAQEGAMSAVFL